MREGFILLHRQSITPESWKTPERTLAWIDFLTLADWDTGIVTASYGFLANRWRISKGTIHYWIRGWITERSIEPLTERSTELKKQIKRNKSRETNDTLAAMPRPDPEQTKPTTSDSDSGKKLPKHLEAIALYAVLFDVKFETRAEWSVFIERNVKLSKKLSELPVETLVAAMLIAEDHWSKSGDYEMRLETVHKFVENVGKTGLPDNLKPRAAALLNEFEKRKITIFLPTPVHAGQPA